MDTAGSSSVPFRISPKTAGSFTNSRWRMHGNLEALGHGIVGDDPALIGGIKHGLQFRKRFRLDDPRLVRKHMQAGAHTGQQAVDFVAVVAGQHHHVTASFRQHPIQAIRPREDFELPASGMLAAVVELGDAVEVRGQVRAQRRVEVGGVRHPGQRFALEQGGVEVSRIQGDDFEFLSRGVNRQQSEHRQGSVAPSAPAVTASSGTG